MRGTRYGDSEESLPQRNRISCSCWPSLLGCQLPCRWPSASPCSSRSTFPIPTTTAKCICRSSRPGQARWHGPPDSAAWFIPWRDRCGGRSSTRRPPSNSPPAPATTTSLTARPTDAGWSMRPTLKDAVELWVVESATRKHAATHTGGAVNVEPRFSPDGKHIAFVSTSFNGHFHIFVGDSAMAN